MSNPGYTKNHRISLRPGSPGVIQLTTTALEILEPPITGDTRWVLGGSRVYNLTDSTPAKFFLYYVPTGGSPTDARLFGGVTVDPEDYVQLGEFPMVPGFSIYAKASANNVLNIIPFYEEIE